MSTTSSVKSAGGAAAAETRPGAPADEYADTEVNYQPKTLRFWTILIGMYLSIFLVALDRTIIATAIPKITDEFDSIADIGWYGSGYMLTAACAFPISGRIYQLYATKWTFLASIVVFEVGSALCGAAPSSAAFIVGRAIAGIGSAGIFSGGIMMMIPLIPLRKRPIYTAFFGMVFGISSVLGPVLGGTFTDKVTWRWCFYLNLPIGAFTLVATALLFPSHTGKLEKLSLFDQFRRLDPIGIALFAPSMVCLILALQWGGTTDPWSAPKIIGLLVTFAVLLIIFIVYEVLTPETAMVPARVVMNRSIAAAMFYMLLLSGSMMCLVYYLAIWFQAAKGDSAMDAGVSTLPLVLGMVVMSIVTAKTTEKIGYYVPAMLICPIFCSIGCGLLSTLKVDSGSNLWIGFQVIYGIGIGTGFQTVTLAAQTVLPRADVPIGQALTFLVQQLGGSVFLSVGQNIFSTKLIDMLSGVAGLNTEAIINTGATNLRTIVPPSELDTVLNAYSYSITRVFLLAAGISAATILGAAAMEWKSIKGPKDAGSPQRGSEAKLEEGEKPTTGPSGTTTDV
ncbi:putative aflatoxin efflux pump [Thozetella sp. PMI_491]|nr:putative aflatoxin efflux pump [Thozetella sp. PMI_491]